MLNRLLLITYEGAPRSWVTTAGEARDEILKLAAEDADLVDVWSLHRDHRGTKLITLEYCHALQELRSRAVALPSHLRIVR